MMAFMRFFLSLGTFLVIEGVSVYLFFHEEGQVYGIPLVLGFVHLIVYEVFLRRLLLVKKVATSVATVKTVTTVTKQKKSLLAFLREKVARFVDFFKTWKVEFLKKFHELQEENKKKEKKEPVVSIARMETAEWYFHRMLGEPVVRPSPSHPGSTATLDEYNRTRQAQGSSVTVPVTPATSTTSNPPSDTSHKAMEAGKNVANAGLGWLWKMFTLLGEVVTKYPLMSLAVILFLFAVLSLFSLTGEDEVSASSAHKMLVFGLLGLTVLLMATGKLGKVTTFLFEHIPGTGLALSFICGVIAHYHGWSIVLPVLVGIPFLIFAVGAEKETAKMLGRAILKTFSVLFFQEGFGKGIAWWTVVVALLGVTAYGLVKVPGIDIPDSVREFCTITLMVTSLVYLVLLFVFFGSAWMRSK